MPCDTPLLVYKSGERVKIDMDYMGLEHKAIREDVLVPCGKCPPCKERFIREWCFRLQKEFKGSTSGCFVTLTYSTPNVPISKCGRLTLDPTDLQKFMKRLRYYSKGISVRYFGVGEYGSERKRPHYHVVLFNIDDLVKVGEDAKGQPIYRSTKISKSWTLGNVHIGGLTEASVAYTLKYISKPGTIPEYEGDKREPEFNYKSRNLGISYIERAGEFHKRNPHITKVVNNGHDITMPRYLRKKLFTDKERMMQARIMKRESEKWQEEERKTAERLSIEYYRFKDMTMRNKYRSFYKHQKKRNG